MSAFPAHYRLPATSRAIVLRSLVRHVNMGALAFVMFVALALLNATQGKDFEIRGSAPPKAPKTEVAIDYFSFSPQTIVVPVGTTVTWTNHDNVPHVVTSANNRFNKSSVLKAGETFSNTFVTAGTYSYFCSIHPQMKGKITVR
jgi:plastocyanin